MVLATLLLVACQNDEIASEVPAGKGHIQLRLSADDALQTRTLQDVTDVETWYAVVSNASETFYNKQIGTELEALPFEAGTYSIAVRNYDTMADAIAAADGWGVAYYEGTATDVEVSAGGIAYVNINCGKALNAKFRLDYSEFSGIINSFTVTSPKTITFSYAAGTLANEAFFAPNATLTYTINYTIAGETKTTTAQTLTLGAAATVSILRIKSDTNGGVVVALTYDDEFETEGEVAINLDGTTGNTLN